MKNLTELFGSAVFNDSVMRERLPSAVYKKLRETIDNDAPLEADVADVVANAMKDWAIEHGATHFTHWFHPMTGITAEKHDSFISPAGNGKIIMEFSGKELIKGEPDASSFPSGGLRATFEARGYTAWDPTSPAFLKDTTLYIPTAFCSYTGEILDKKVPLLRSMEVLSNAAVRVLHHFEDTKDVKKVTSTVGPEQEYFLVDKALYDRRNDLRYCGRTLFGAMPPKGQEMEDHYFGAIKTRVAEYMKDLDEELWKLGILAKTKHNEVAPAQHELAPIFSTTNIATDHNQLVMETMKRIAPRHGLACLLHEKPFDGVNGSGKHNNWSLSTDTGINLFRPGSKPENNKRFLLFLVAVIKAVDEYQDLLRISVASAGNDHRLGANEAPPAIISIYIGDHLAHVMDSIEHHAAYTSNGKKRMALGVHVLPDLKQDTTDRNRTSPFAFTGNKFEFRMLGSAFSIAGPNIVLNTIVADVLNEFADVLDKTDDEQGAIDTLIRDTYVAHKRIVFNGNNYSAEWVAEAGRRGLSNFRSTPDALVHFADPKNVALFERNNIFSKVEVESRTEILLENYSKIINIEALTLLDMYNKELLPAIMKYEDLLSETFKRKKAVSEDLDTTVEKSLLVRISELATESYRLSGALSEKLAAAHRIDGAAENAKFYETEVLAGMNALRAVIDKLEVIIGDEYWPVPTYDKLLFSVDC